MQDCEHLPRLESCGFLLLLPSPLLYLSAFFEATRDVYYKQLYNISSSGSWNEWFSYFLNGVAVQAQEALSRAERINAFIVGWQIKVGGRSEIVQHIIKYLAVNPYCTIKKIAENNKVAFTTAQRALCKLESLGILAQNSIGKEIVCIAHTIF